MENLTKDIECKRVNTINPEPFTTESKSLRVIEFRSSGVKRFKDSNSQTLKLPKLLNCLLIFSLCLCVSVVCCVFAVSVFAQNELAKEYYEQGKEYYRQGRYREAKEEFEKALELNKMSQIKIEPVQKQQERLGERKEDVVEIGTSWEYTIGEGDVLEISVWEWSDLSRDVIVRPDGRLSFPLIGDLPASGFTLPELDRGITEALKDFIRHPEVSVAVKKIGGYKIIMFGEVKTPGVYRLEEKGKGSILEAVALAGGFTTNAVIKSIAVIKGGDIKNPKIALIDATKIFKRADLSQNIPLESGDIVYVPRRFISDINYFLTQMIGPLTTVAFTTTTISAIERGR